MKTAKFLLAEGFQQRTNTGYFNNEGALQFFKERTKKSNKDTLSSNALKWENTVHAMRSSSSSIRHFIQVSYDSETIEEIRSDCISVKLRKSDPDQTSFAKAMSGEEREEYWKACQFEYDTLENKMEACEIVDRYETMNVLPGILALRGKRRSDALVKKYKSIFCVRGNNQIDQVDFFDGQLYSSICNWSTI